MKLYECPSSRIVSDRFYDLIHRLLDLFDDRLDKICFSGSFSLNAHGVLNRPISDIDLCITDDVFFDSIRRLRERLGSWFASDTSDSKDFHRFTLIENDGAKLCIYRHTSFPIGLCAVNLHGRFVQLYPAIDIVRYKTMTFLPTGSSKKMSEKTVQKHMSDILAFTWMAKRNVSAQLHPLLPAIVEQANAYCKNAGYDTRYEMTAGSDTSRNGLTFRRLVSASAP